MRAVVQYLPTRQTYQVWIIVSGTVGESVIRPLENVPDVVKFGSFEEFDAATEVPPTFEMPRDAFEALMQAGGAPTAPLLTTERDR